MFGRGMRAGIDRREQKKVAATLEADMLRKVRSEWVLTRVVHVLDIMQRESRRRLPSKSPTCCRGRAAWV